MSRCWWICSALPSSYNAGRLIALRRARRFGISANQGASPVCRPGRLAAFSADSLLPRNIRHENAIARVTVFAMAIVLLFISRFIVPIHAYFSRVRLTRKPRSEIRKVCQITEFIITRKGQRQPRDETSDGRIPGRTASSGGPIGAADRQAAIEGR